MKSTGELIDAIWDLSSRINASGDKRGQELQSLVVDLEKSINAETNSKSSPSLAATAKQGTPRA